MPFATHVLKISWKDLHDETSETSEEKLQQLKPREKWERKKPARFSESSDSTDNIMEESVEEYIGTNEEEKKRRNVVFLAKRQMHVGLLPRK